MVVCNWRSFNFSHMEAGNNPNILVKISKKFLRSRIPQVRSSKNSLSNTLRREVELNLYLLLRGRYQRLHLVPHYILIKISLLDKFDTQARCNFFLPPYILTSSQLLHPYHLYSTVYPPLLTRAPHHFSPPTHIPPFLISKKTKSSKFGIQFVKNNTSKGEFQNIFNKATAYAGLNLVPTLYRFFKNIISKSLLIIY